jgi:uncharacterized cupin superfamily protein
MLDITIANLRQMENPHIFLDGSVRSTRRLASITVGRGEYKPGWQWSKHAGPQTGKKSEKHIGYIEQGRMTIRTENDERKEIGPGDFFEVGAGHDACVVGDEVCVALDFTIV